MSGGGTLASLSSQGIVAVVILGSHLLPVRPPRIPYGLVVRSRLLPEKKSGVGPLGGRTGLWLRKSSFGV